MKGPHPGHVTFYDQLGVPSGASAEEIREAYRALARLLHPDQQTDPHLKSVAEQQMRKLNPIYTVLSDPERRRRYDEDLEDQYSTPIILEGPAQVRSNRVFGRMVWTAAILAAVGLLYWLATGNTGSGEFEPRAAAVTIPTPTNLTQTSDASQIAVLRSQIKTLTAERDFAMHELVRLKLAATGSSRDAPPPMSSPPSIQALTDLPSAPKPATPVNLLPPRTETPAPKPTLAGFWFYSRPKDVQKNKSQSLYTPEYIETTISEKNGVLTGKYSSRFQIADRAISPEVNFTFAGTPNGSILTCPWNGRGGAKGEVTLRLMSDNSVRIDWAASELGSQQGLASGTAVLTRRID
jgi:hypothetical protein